MRRPPRSISARSIPRCRPRSSTGRKIRWRSSRPRSSTRCRSTARSPTTCGTASGSWPTAAPGRSCRRMCATIVAKHINEAGVKQREDVAKLNAGLQQELAGKGLAFNQPERGAVPRQAARGRLLRGVEGQVRRRGLGAAGEVRRQAGVSGRRGLHGARPITAASCVAVAARCSPARRRSLAASIEAWPRRGWSRSRPRCWSSPRSSSCSPAWSRATSLHRPLVWSDELASILFLWLAMLGAVGRVPPRRAHADDGGRRQRQPAMRAYLDAGRDRGRAGVPAADRLAGLRIRLRRELHHHAGAGDHQRLARRGAAGRHRPDGAVRAACGCCASGDRADRAGGARLSVALVVAVFWLAAAARCGRSATST